MKYGLFGSIFQHKSLYHSLREAMFKMTLFFGIVEISYVMFVTRGIPDAAKWLLGMIWIGLGLYLFIFYAIAETKAAPKPRWQIVCWTLSALLNGAIAFGPAVHMAVTDLPALLKAPVWFYLISAYFGLKVVFSAALAVRNWVILEDEALDRERQGALRVPPGALW